MNSQIIAYNLPELEKKIVLSKAENLYKSRVVSMDQWRKIQEVFATKLYTPTIFMRILLFIVSLVGMLTIMGPFALIFGDIGESGYRFLTLILGCSLLFLTDHILIKGKFHYKSGVTEAGMYAGLMFIAFALLGGESHNELVYLLVGFLLAAFAAIRYLNLTALVVTIGFFGGILFQILMDIGGVAQALMPFIFMISFALIYWGSKELELKLSKVYLNNQIIIIQTISLILIYVAGNYFVVRELSVKLLDLSLTENQNIPFAYVFCGFTALIPIAYIYWGLKHKSIMFIRVALLTLALSVITLKIYFSLGMPIVTITISGAVLIISALLFLNYFKQIRHGFTREKLLNDKWSSPDLMAFIASQTLVGQQIQGSEGNNDPIPGGGSFGGAGAGGNW